MYAERRKEPRFCEGHLEFATTLARIEEKVNSTDKTVIAVDKRINGSIDDLRHHINNSRGRNLAIALFILGLIISAFSFARDIGKNEQQIKVNTEHLGRLQ